MDFTKQLNDLKGEVTQLTATRDADDQEKSLKYRKVTDNLDRIANLAGEVQNAVANLPGLGNKLVKAEVGSKMDEIRTRVRDVNDFIGDTKAK